MCVILLLLMAELMRIKNGRHTGNTHALAEVISKKNVFCEKRN
jgi:hypothetical protein